METRRAVDEKVAMAKGLLKAKRRLRRIRVFCILFHMTYLQLFSTNDDCRNIKLLRRIVFFGVLREKFALLRRKYNFDDGDKTSLFSTTGGVESEIDERFKQIWRCLTK